MQHVRVMGYLFVLGSLAVVLVGGAPSATAAAYCVEDVKEPYPYDDCDGVACYGHNSQTAWQYCVPPDGLCSFQTDCCYYTPGGQPFYCP